ESDYHPEPPRSLERGASVPAPAEDYVYVPGIWVFQRRFVWRPGFWVRHRPGWVWVPDCYKWTPVGHVFVHGYWDAPLVDRRPLQRRRASAAGDAGAAGEGGHEDPRRAHRRRRGQ